MLWIVFNFCYYSVFILVPIIIFVMFSKDDNFHSSGGLLYFIKFVFGRRAIAKKQKKIEQAFHSKNPNLIEEPKCNLDETFSDRLSFCGTDQNGNQLNLKFTLRANHISEIDICAKINDSVYILPNKIDDTVKEHKLWVKSVARYQWKCQGLNIEILEPLKKARITFNGLLMDISLKNFGTVKHVKLNFIWTCCSKPIVSCLDDNLNLLTSSLAQTTWRNGHWLDLLGNEKGYKQFGALKGTIYIENCDEFELNMGCMKKRYWGDLESEVLEKSMEIFAYTENGYILHLGVKSIKQGCRELKYGHLFTLNGNVYPIKSSDFDLDKMEQSISNKMTIHVKANSKLLKLCLSINETSKLEFVNNNFQGFKIQQFSAECTINNKKGISILEYWNSRKGTGIKKPTPILKESFVENIPEIVVANLDSEEAKILELTGGKGNSLALMKSLKNEEIQIPDGFVVTTYAFQQQIENNFTLKRSLLLLEDIALGKENGNLENACEATVELFKGQPVIQSVSQKIVDELMKFRRKHDEKIIPYLRWAVRSSATGEDSEEFSSAGQNETYLGCQTDKDVITKIAKCWASLFTFQSVTYRRHHGLPIQTSMAVVVQKMIPADSAGVLFTCHPSDSNPSKMVITSNFGLGETVVSGESEPDTIILSKTFDGVVTFDTSTAGSKNNQLLMSRYGVHKKILDEEKSRELSLSKEHALKLGKIGVILEEAFGGPRDIEWAYLKDQLYILQSRPVTTLSQWTNYELLHEFDSPHLSNDTFYTRANVGEVFPFAITALTQSIILQCIDNAYQIRISGKYNPYTRQCTKSSHHFCMIDLLSGLYARPRKEVDIVYNMCDLAVFGHIVLNEEINKKAIERNGILSSFDNLKEIIKLIKDLWSASDILKTSIEISQKSDIKINKKDTIIDMYHKINKYLDTIQEVVDIHCAISSFSIVYQTFAMITMVEGKKEITLENSTDLALILSSCDDVISAEVPWRLEEIADVLKKLNLAEKFISISAKDGVVWLRDNCVEAYGLFKEFIEIHGHRVLGEFDLGIEPWEANPSAVIELIQTNCKLGSSSKKRLDVKKDVVEDLTSPKKKLTKMILRFLIVKNRVAVGNREKSKSALIKVTNKLRKSYKILAQEMVREGLMPSEKLIFHLTHYEVWQLINGKNPNLIAKATKRQKLYPVWNKQKFPEIMYDIPKPEEDIIPNFDAIQSDTVCIGTPVCIGEVTARACVIASLDEIDCLKDGDILITKSTDIGWSPYFPILSGIITELGGLMSHGAVVAREYGLPCLVGAKNATKLFQTGNTVHLSGKNGTIKLISNQ